MSNAAPAPSACYSANYLSRLAKLIDRIDVEEVDAGVELVRRAWRAGRQIITLGNGGSAATAQHFATDWSKGVFQTTGRRLRGRTLIDNIGILTAYANDLSYSDVFSEQMRNVAEPGDLVVAVSGSGNSENVVRAVNVANGIGCETLALVGFSGGRLKAAAQHVIWVQSQDMQLVEDVHAVFGHIVMQALCGMMD